MKILFKCSIFILLVACSQNKYFKVDEVKLFSIDSVSIVKLDPIVVKSDLVGLRDISLFDSLLLVLNSNDVGIISIFDTNTDTLILTVGSKGRGPNEYMSPYFSKHYSIDSNGDLITNIRDNLVRNRPLNITQTIVNRKAICEKDKAEDLDRYTTFYIGNDVRFTKSKVRTSGSSFKTLKPEYNYLNKENSVEFNVYPNLIANSVEPMAAIYLYLGEFMGVKPDNRKVVDFSYMLNRFVIFDLENFTTLSVEESGSPKIEDFKNLSRADMIPLGYANYLDAHLTDKYIIALYDGRNYYEIEDKDKRLEPTIRVFSWEGELLKQYKIDESAMRIAYCENTNYLYALDMEDRLIKYKLDL